MTRMFIARCQCGLVVAAGDMEQDYAMQDQYIRTLANRGYVVSITDEGVAPPLVWALNACDRNDCAKSKWINTQPGFHTV